MESSRIKNEIITLDCLEYNEILNFRSLYNRKTLRDVPQQSLLSGVSSSKEDLLGTEIISCKNVPRWQQCVLKDVNMSENNFSITIVLDVKLADGTKVLLSIDSMQKTVEVKYPSDAELDEEALEENIVLCLRSNNCTYNLCDEKVTTTTPQSNTKTFLKEISMLHKKMVYITYEKNEYMECKYFSQEPKVGNELSLSCVRISRWKSCVFDSMISNEKTQFLLRITLNNDAVMYLDVNTRYGKVLCHYNDGISDDILYNLHKDLETCLRTNHVLAKKQKLPPSASSNKKMTQVGQISLSGKKQALSFVHLRDYPQDSSKELCKNILSWKKCEMQSILTKYLSLKVTSFDNEEIFVTLDARKADIVLSCTYDSMCTTFAKQVMEHDMYTFVHENACVTLSKTLSRKSSSMSKLSLLQNDNIKFGMKNHACGSTLNSLKKSFSSDDMFAIAECESTLENDDAYKSQDVQDHTKDFRTEFLITSIRARSTLSSSSIKSNSYEQSLCSISEQEEEVGTPS